LHFSQRRVKRIRLRDRIVLARIGASAFIAGPIEPWKPGHSLRNELRPKPQARQVEIPAYRAAALPQKTRQSAPEIEYQAGTESMGYLRGGTVILALEWCVAAGFGQIEGRGGGVVKAALLGQRVA